KQPKVVYLELCEDMAPLLTELRNCRLPVAVPAPAPVPRMSHGLPILLSARFIGGPDQLGTMQLTFEGHGSIGRSREALEFAP
ncbi:hypothetical protein ABZT34_40715, partial [Streptomyces sp. NPDC005329]|uniref:hypothetical protein n=1 Tax=Streptomyces sp. NPDC005329 TaxID=3157034 RepID=UPI0033B8AD2D